jgi:hypothetical protein
MNHRLLLPAMVLGSLLSPFLAGLPGSTAVATAATPPAPAPTPSSELQRCAPPQPGRYVAMGQGEAKGEPVARLVSETWSADGRISGVRMERRGRTYREMAYTGSYRPISLCRVAIERTYADAISRSQAVLDLGGHPRYSLGTLPDVVVASRWFRQSAGTCTASLLDGTVLSAQQGLSWKNGAWQPNAVVQRESWQAGKVRGIAISSFGPTIGEATYKGTISVTPDCLATVVEKDSLGVTYNYRGLVLADGSGYLYLQTDPNDLTVAWLERLKP